MRKKVQFEEGHKKIRYQLVMNTSNLLKIHTYIQASSWVYLTHSKGLWPLGPLTEFGNNSKYSNIVTFFQVWFWMVKSRWLLPLFLPLPIPPHKSTTQYPRNPKSHLWGSLVPHQRLETTYIILDFP